MDKTNLAGFTLVEMMVTVTIVGILTAIAVPNYIEYVRNGKRADAKAALTSFANAMEVWKMQNGNSYSGAGTPSDTDGAPKATVFPNKAPLSGGTKTYDLKVTVTAADATTTPPTPQGYVVKAIPVDSTDACGTLTLSNLGATTAATTGCW